MASFRHAVLSHHNEQQKHLSDYIMQKGKKQNISFRTTLISLSSWNSTGYIHYLVGIIC